MLNVSLVVNFAWIEHGFYRINMDASIYHTVSKGSGYVASPFGRGRCVEPMKRSTSKGSGYVASPFGRGHCVGLVRPLTSRGNHYRCSPSILEQSVLFNKQLTKSSQLSLAYDSPMKDTIKRILVPLDPTAYAQAATESACRIARVHTAQVAGVTVLDSEEIRSSVVPAIGPYYPILRAAVRDKTKHAEAILKDCMDRFAQTCEKMRVGHLETEYEGIPAQKLLDSAIFYDLVVVGLKTSFHFETRKESIEGLDEILDRTVTPILAVPVTGLETPDKVLVAFDGSLGSARALHDFARYAFPYQCNIKIIVGEKEPEEADFLLRNAEAFLRAHGFDQVMTEAIEKPIEDVVDEAIAAGINLVVAGIHSKKKFQDIFVGSFTKALIDRGDVSIFLSH